MTIVKRRPRIRLRAPAIVLPGQEFEVIVLLDAKRSVPIERLQLSLEGVERTFAGGVAHSSRAVAHLGTTPRFISGSTSAVPEGWSVYSAEGSKWATPGGIGAIW